MQTAIVNNGENSRLCLCKVDFSRFMWSLSCVLAGDLLGFNGLSLSQHLLQVSVYRLFG